MRNFAHYEGDCFAVFREAVGRKTDETVKLALEGCLDEVSQRFELYAELFENNSLEILTECADIAHLRVELESLYGSQTAAYKTIKKAIEDAQPRTIKYCCPFCTINLHDTLDHFVPKSAFPEFAINPHNLLPCCSECNSKKSDDWRKVGGQKLLFNFYKDVIPTDQFLFVDIYLDRDGELDFAFNIRQPAAVNNDHWSLLEYHYRRLNLRARFRKAAITILTETLNSVQNSLDVRQPEADIKAQLLADANSNKRHYGENHWKPIMLEGLANSPAFWQSFEG